LGAGVGGKPPDAEEGGPPPIGKKLPLDEMDDYSPRQERGGFTSRLYEGIDWHFIWRISHAQFFLSMISSLCLLISLHFTGFNVFRFTSSAWATYLACVAVVGIRAGRYRNYSYLVAFAGMVTFQTVIYMSSLCWLAYSLYALDYHVNYAYRGHGYMLGISHDLAMALIIIEVVSLLCTIFTGFFGLVAVCRGIGSMMKEMEAVIMDSRGPPPQITVRPLV
ncbi:hypothetical protein PFISCL1PPCAC_22455, partial [Pristionchus fissidentatus]